MSNVTKLVPAAAAAAAAGAAAAEVPAKAIVEIPAHVLPDLTPTAIATDAFTRIAAIVNTLFSCSYCRGRGDYAAVLTRDDGTQLRFAAECGQCRGSGRRDINDAQRSITQLFRDLEDAFLPDEDDHDAPF